MHSAGCRPSSVVMILATSASRNICCCMRRACTTAFSPSVCGDLAVQRLRRTFTAGAGEQIGEERVQLPLLEFDEAAFPAAGANSNLDQVSDLSDRGEVAH